jgi:hypothetical protein
MLKAIGQTLLVIAVLAGIVAGLAIAVAVVLACAVLTVVIGLTWLPAQYFVAMKEQLAAEPPEAKKAEDGWLGRAFRVARHVDSEHSLPHYFFGPAEVDVRTVMRGSSDRISSGLRSGWEIGQNLVFETGGEGIAVIGIIPGIGILIGIVPGAISGIAVTGAVAVMHVALSLAGAAVSALTGIVLRGVDAATRFAAGIRLTCPICAHAVRPYATYVCPGCGELHHDIRPGRRGIIWRVCRCGHRMPTLLLVGADRLSAMCPECGAGLPKLFGKIATIVIPFFGSVKAGKTQLIYTLVLELDSLITGNGGTVELHDDTRHELNRIGERLSTTGSTRPTVARTPEAFILRIKIGLSERYIYLFDPAGELLYRTDSLDELNYFDKASTLVFVADPLAAEGPWSKLSVEEQGTLSPIRSNWAEVELAYELPREQMRRMGSKDHHMRLAFVISKKDVFAKAETGEEKGGSVKEFVSADEGMDLGNLVREAKRSFDDVGFFWTAAITDESGVPDTSIEELAMWLLHSEGITIGGVPGDGRV